MNYPAASCEVSNISPPLTGGDEGEGEMKHKITPTLTPPINGEGIRGNPEAELRGIL